MNLTDRDPETELALAEAPWNAAEEAFAALGGESVRRFVLAGNATFTLLNPTTGNRFTFRVRAKEMDDGAKLHFVSVLTGPDNTSNYTFLGTIFADGAYRHGRKSHIQPRASSALAFAWFWTKVRSSPLAPDLGPAQVHHMGKCGRCGRALTVPESISLGLGPECADKV